MAETETVFRVRVAGPSDTAGVDALLAASYPALLKHDYPPSVMVTILPLISRARPELLRSGTYFVAETGEGRIVGAGGWTRGRPDTGRRFAGLAHVRHVVSDHRLLRQGIGRAVMDHVFATARAAGFGEIEALSTRTAVPFYAALGFVAMGEVAVPIGPAGIAFPAERMRRPL